MRCQYRFNCKQTHASSPSRSGHDLGDSVRAKRRTRLELRVVWLKLDRDRCWKTGGSTLVEKQGRSSVIDDVIVIGRDGNHTRRGIRQRENVEREVCDENVAAVDEKNIPGNRGGCPSVCVCVCVCVCTKTICLLEVQEKRRHTWSQR